MDWLLWRRFALPFLRYFKQKIQQLFQRHNHPLEAQKLISISQKTFLRPPVTNIPSANGLTLLEEFNRMPCREQCYKILHASKVAQLKLKYHTSMYLWFYLLSSKTFRSNSEMRLYKMYVYQGLAISFAIFHCSYNAMLEWLHYLPFGLSTVDVGKTEGAVHPGLCWWRECPVWTFVARKIHFATEQHVQALSD